MHRTLNQMVELWAVIHELMIAVAKIGTITNTLGPTVTVISALYCKALL